VAAVHSLLNVGTSSARACGSSPVIRLRVQNVL
jgi:hypothetical protein